mgnify:CR=1 FL=1
MTFSDPNLSVDHRRRCCCRRCRRCRCRKLFTFSSSPEPRGKFEPTWVKGIQVCSNEGPRIFPRGDDNESVKMY